MEDTYCQMAKVHQLLSELEKTKPEKSWVTFYLPRILDFFEHYMSSVENMNRPLMSITEVEVNNFLRNLTFSHNDKVNYYQALKYFFDYAAKKDVATPFYLKVAKLTQQPKKTVYISEPHLKKIIEFINSNEKIEQRLTLALFLYTGLSRKYIANLSMNQISDDLCYFRFNQKNEIPIKTELTRVLKQYITQAMPDRDARFFSKDENVTSTNVKSYSKKACGHSYSPTEFSNTFIVKTLGRDEKWKNIFVVSRLTLESYQTIAKHVSDTPRWLVDEQSKLLKTWP